MRRIGVGTAWALACCGALGACSAGLDPPVPSELPDVPAPPEVPVVSFGELESELGGLEAELVALPTTVPATLPDTGEATYEGVMAMEIANVNLVTGQPDPIVLNGEMAMAVDFGATSDPISGTATNFVSSDNEAYGGSLEISDSTLERGGDPLVEFTYGAEVDGALRNQGDTIWVLEGDLTGDFKGPEGTHAFGVHGGEACLQATVCVGYDGNFVAEQ